MMKRVMLLIVFVIISTVLYPKNSGGLKTNDTQKISSQNLSKILSGKLIETMMFSKKSTSGNLKNALISSCRVILYFDAYPSASQIKELEDQEVSLYFNTWTPPVESHRYGFIVASVPTANIKKVIELPFVKKIDWGERSSRAMNNSASLSINAQMVWTKGYKGKGKKICILDSGIDISYAGSDFPSSFEYKDYSYFPEVDDNVANTITGHGTHVAATALGRGVLSEGQNHWNNGKGAFKGMAPDADLVFLKIGQDEDAFAEDAPIIAAIDAAVNVYHADIISMSYGGWDDYHDGSSAVEQKVDWAYSQGVPFFCSAGNDANMEKHWRGTVAANSQSDFIEVNVNDPAGEKTMLRFNMVWADNIQRSDLSLQYFDSLKQPLGDVTILPATESIKGTESCYSWYNQELTSAGTFYVKVVNNSNQAREVHIFEDWNNQRNGSDRVYFSNADPSFTIVSPASALHAFAVGAYVSKTGWTNPEDHSRWWGPSSVLNNIAPFSSLGPTLDQRIKPDICAPGAVVLSLRDKDVYKTLNNSWIDNDGLPGGDANYYSMRGTSMACPVVAGAAALFLEKHPDASPQQVYDAMKNFSNESGLSNLPNNTWGYGKLDINNAIQNWRNKILVDGDMADDRYKTLAAFTSGQNGFGTKNNLGELKYHTDGENLFIGITGEVTSNDNILLFFDFSGVQGRGSSTLGGGNSGDFVYCSFAYMGNVQMDFDVDFALGFNEGNSTQFEFFTDAIRYGTSNKAANIGKTNQMGGSSNFEIGSVFGGSGFITVAYDSSFSVNRQKGVEIKIPISAFAGVDTSQALRLFAVISSMEGNVSNECIPGNPGANNLGNGADFASIPNQDFFTQPVKISAPQATTFVLSNEDGLIDDLIVGGYGDGSLYDALIALEPASGGIISQSFLDVLSNCPAGSQIFTKKLNEYAHLKGGICINTDGTVFTTIDIAGRNYHGINGYSTYPPDVSGTGRELFTYADNPEYYIDAVNGSTTYKVFAIAWAQESTLSVSTNTLNVAAANNSAATFNVTSNISWTVSSDQSWLSVSPANGTGNETITVTAQANPTAATRTATVTVSGTGVASQTVTVTQAAGAATLTVSTNTLKVASANNSTATFNITSNISWTVSSDQNWLSVNPASGTGNGTITVTAQANPTAATRTATVTVSGSGVTSQTVTVTQVAGTATLTVSTNNLNVASANGSIASFNVTSNINWTVSSDQSWLSVSPANGTGNGTITVTAEANPTVATRSANVTVSGTGVTSQTVTVTQSAGTVTLSVSPLSLDVAASEGSSSTFTITSNTGWVVLSNETWLKVSKPFGNGNSEVMVIAEANPTADERTGTIMVSATGAGTQTVTVTQAAGEATLTVSPLTINIAATECDTTITITSNTSWTVASGQSWLTVNPSSGSGNGTVTLRLEANPSSSARTATISVTGTGATSQTVMVTQPGTVGILDHEQANVRVYPNPFSDGFYVDQIDGTTIVSVFAPDGRRIFRKEISSAEFIPAGLLMSGVYLVELNGNKTSIKVRIVKK